MRLDNDIKYITKGISLFIAWKHLRYMNVRLYVWNFPDVCVCVCVCACVRVCVCSLCFFHSIHHN